MVKERGNTGFVTLLGLVLTLAIVLILCYMVFNLYFKKPALDERTKESLLKDNIDTSSHRSTLDSVNKRVQEYNKRVLEHEQEIEGIGKLQ